MDCQKVGRLILQLRKEKGLTQQQVADQLHISNKTVSKWECGLGCPDAALWNQLSDILGADILVLLQGELNPNRPDIGKISNVKFYVCSVCGNILVSTGETSVSCCGRKISPLEVSPFSEEHKMTVDKIDMEYYVTLDHPMKKNHYIAFSAYVHDDRVLLIRLYPEQSPEFYLPAGKRKGILYVYCTSHGLQKYPLRL